MPGKKKPTAKNTSRGVCSFCGSGAQDGIPTAFWPPHGGLICPECLCDEYDFAAEALEATARVLSENAEMREGFAQAKSLRSGGFPPEDFMAALDDAADSVPDTDDAGERPRPAIGRASAAARHAASAAPGAPRRAASPREIKEYLDAYIVGQEQAKKAIAVAVYNHYKRVDSDDAAKLDAKFKDVEVEKSNILLIGPTGTGKTLIARTLARFLDVPFAIADATTLTEAGYVGEDVENILLNLIQSAGGDIAKAERGIVFVDEIDKIGRRTENVSITRDVSGEGVQQALLKILEGTVAHVPPAGGRKHPEQKYLELETKDILFICGGAFVGLDAGIKRRRGKSNFGFGNGEPAKSGAVAANGLLRPEPEDLIHFGLIPEFVGRLPVVASLAELTESDLRHILTVPKNSLVSQYRKLMAQDGVDLTFDDDAIIAIAKESLKRKTGARGLRAIMEELMLDVMYEAASDPKSRRGDFKLAVTAQMVEAQLAFGKPLAEAIRAS